MKNLNLNKNSMKITAALLFAQSPLLTPIFLEKTMKRNFLTIALFSILAILPVSAQTDSFVTTFITKEDGIAFVNIAKNQRFAFIIKGNSPSVKKLDSAAFRVTVNGVTSLVKFTNKSEFFDATTENSDAAILERWRNFDIGGTESEIKDKLKVAENARNDCLFLIFDRAARRNLLIRFITYFQFHFQPENTRLTFLLAMATLAFLCNQ